MEPLAYPIHTAGPWQRTGRGVYQLLTCFATFWRHHRVPRWVTTGYHETDLWSLTVHGIRMAWQKRASMFWGLIDVDHIDPNPFNILQPIVQTLWEEGVSRFGFRAEGAIRIRGCRCWNHQLYDLLSGSEFSPEMKRWIVWGQTKMTNLVPNDMLPHPNWCFGFEGLVGWDNTRTNMYDKEQMIAGNGIGTSKHGSNQYLHSLFQFVGSHLRNEIPTLPGMFFERNC